MRQVTSRFATDQVDHERIDGGVGRPEHALGVTGQQDAVDAECEPDAVRGRSAHRLGKAVVASAAADRVLRRIERLGRELESGAAVVVQAAHQPRSLLVADLQRVQAGEHAGVVRCGVLGQVVRDERRLRDHDLVLGTLGVQYPQRVALEGHPGGLGQFVESGPEVHADGVGVALAVLVLTERVDQQPDLEQSERLEEPTRQSDDLDVEVRVVDAERLDTDLVEHAVAALLRAFVTEVRAGVPDLPRQHRSVLHEGPHDPRRHLGTQRDAAAVLVGEVVHLLGDDVGRLADAQEHTQVLDQGRYDLAVPGRLALFGEPRHERSASRRFRMQDVAHTPEGLELLASGVGHGSPRYRSDRPGPETVPASASLSTAGRSATVSRSALAAIGRGGLSD